MKNYCRLALLSLWDTGEFKTRIIILCLTILLPVVLVYGQTNKTVSAAAIVVNCSSCSGTGTIKTSCPQCKGSGDCGLCNGSGQLPGLGETTRTCSCSITGKPGQCQKCSGTGKLIQACNKCKGTGRVIDANSITQVKQAYLNALQQSPSLSSSNTHDAENDIPNIITIKESVALTLTNSAGSVIGSYEIPPLTKVQVEGHDATNVYVILNKRHIGVLKRKTDFDDLCKRLAEEKASRLAEIQEKERERIAKIEAEKNATLVKEEENRKKKETLKAKLKNATKNEWKAYCSEYFVVSDSGKITGKKGVDTYGRLYFPTIDEFSNIMGNPDRTQSVGGAKYWYYNCSDGVIQIVVPPVVRDDNGRIIGYDSRDTIINDY